MDKPVFWFRIVFLDFDPLRASEMRSEAGAAWFSGCGTGWPRAGVCGPWGESPAGPGA